MAVPEVLLSERARRAYEWGRFRAALPAACLALPMVAISFVASTRHTTTALCGSALALLALLFLWRGQDFGRGARLGFLAGLAPLLLPVVVASTGHLCREGACLLFPTVCICSGVFGGVMVAVLALRRAVTRHFWIPALLVAGLGGSLGCAVAGASGVLGMAVGMTFGASPLFLSPLIKRR